MKRHGVSLGRLLLICSALFMLQAGVGWAKDCGKAREFCASGVRLTNYADRAKAFLKAIELCPSFAEAHVNLADAFENIAKLSKRNISRFNRFLDRAEAQYRQALKYNKNLFPAHLGLGDTYRMMGLYKKSEQAYKTALTIKPGHPEATAGLKSVKAIDSQESEGFKSSEDIVKRFMKSSKGLGPGRLMGFADRTAVKDRLRFNNILFNVGSAELNRGETIEQLQEIGKAISSRDLTDSGFVVEGHTDNTGGYELNMRLSRDRAESVKNYLIENYTLDPSRLKTHGFGYSRPRFPNDTPEHMLKNRRVELLIVQ